MLRSFLRYRYEGCIRCINFCQIVNVGQIPPTPLLQRGDYLYLTETPNGYEVVSYNPDFVEQMFSAALRACDAWVPAFAGMTANSQKRASHASPLLKTKWR